MTARTIPEHGTRARYRRGCTCGLCRAANTAYTNQCKARRLAASDLAERADRAGHGKAGTYANYACRCQPCRTANAAASARKRTRDREGT